MTHTAETRCARCSAHQRKQLRGHPNASYSLLMDRVGVFQKGKIILPTFSLSAGFLARALLGFSSYCESLWVCGSLLGNFLRDVLVKPSLQTVLKTTQTNAVAIVHICQETKETK